MDFPLGSKGNHATSLVKRFSSLLTVRLVVRSHDHILGPVTLSCEQGNFLGAQRTTTAHLDLRLFDAWKKFQ